MHLFAPRWLGGSEREITRDLLTDLGGFGWLAVQGISVGSKLFPQKIQPAALGK